MTPDEYRDLADDVEEWGDWGRARGARRVATAIRDLTAEVERLTRERKYEAGARQEAEKIADEWRVEVERLSGRIAAADALHYEDDHANCETCCTSWGRKDPWPCATHRALHPDEKEE